MDDLEVVESNELGSSQEKSHNNEETEDIFEEEMPSDGEESGDKWIDVKHLKNLSLDELKTLSTDNCKADADRRLDLPITKVVVRRLPPQITVKDYLQELTEVPSYNYIRLVPSNEDLPSRIGKRSSIYINFDTEQEAFWFKEKYNNMKFFDERGNSYIACVDFSFIQDIAEDPLDEAQVGSLEESEMFETFLKAYEEEPWSFTMNRPDNIPTPEVMLDEILNKKITAPDSTPLLQFLRERSQRKEASRKEREQRRKEKDIARRKQKEDIMKRRQKEKEEAAKRKQKDKEDTMKRKPLEEGMGKDREKDTHRDRRRERDRERQRERDRERRLRREREKLEREQTSKSGDDQQATTDKSSQVNKESGRHKSDKDSKQKSSSVNVTYSRSGNVTRWSENSGPRKGDKSTKDDHTRSQEQLNKSTSSTDKLLVEKTTSDNQASNSKPKDISKPTFGKPFPAKADSGTTKDSGNKDKGEVGSGDSCNKTNPNDDGSDRQRRETNPDGGTIKKRIVKRVIKVRKVKDNGGVENSDDITTSQQSGPSESKPKKIVRVVKKSSKSEDGSSSKPAAEVPTKKIEKIDSDHKTEAIANTSDNAKGDTEKDRKLKKGRPEIQIYRPGSLRGGASKSTSSGDKERKSDNNI